MFWFQIISSLAASQALFVGRRICIRLRSLIIGEIFTKALRRKDGAGSSIKSDEKDGEKVGEGKGEITDEELEKASSGKIINLISVDTFRLSEICACRFYILVQVETKTDWLLVFWNEFLRLILDLHFLWPELILTIVVAVYLLFQVLGVSAAAGVSFSIHFHLSRINFESTGTNTTFVFIPLFQNNSSFA